MIKKSPLCVLLTSLLFTTHNYQTIHAENELLHNARSESFERFVDRFDDFDPSNNFNGSDVFDGFNDFDDLDFLNIEGNTEARKIDPEDILKFLLSLNIVGILEEDFFLRTNQLNTRSLLDMPTLGTIQCCRTHKSLFSADLFYNQITRNNFTPHSTDLDSYLALSSDSLIEKIQNTLQVTGPAFDIKTIFSLFKSMTSQQRRTGFMFFYMYQQSNKLISIKAPFYYLERNLFLTPAEQVAIDDELGAGDQEEALELQKKYFIADKIGLGDMRIEVEQPAIHNNSMQLNIGGRLTLPTAFTVQGGILGSSYAKPCALPSVDITQLLVLADAAFNSSPEQMQSAREQGVDLLRSFLLNALDRLSSNLIDTKLGNDGHVGAGVFYRSQSPLSCLIKRQWAHSIHFFSKTSVEYLFPAVEKRFFIKKVNPQEFAARNFSDSDSAISNLKFLADEVINKFYLVALDTRVAPGIIIHSSNKFCYQGDIWGAQVGPDIWLQTAAHLRHIKEPSTPLRHLTVQQLDIQKAQSFLAYQIKIFAGVTCQITHPHTRWFTSLNLDSTLCNSGIGKDYTVSVKVEKHF